MLIHPAACIQLRMRHCTCTLRRRSGMRAGLKAFGSLQCSRQLSEHTSAGVGVTWQPKAGLGLQVMRMRTACGVTEIVYFGASFA